MNVFNTLKGVLQRLFFRNEDIYEIFGVRSVASQAMQTAGTNWRNIYEGKAPWNNDGLCSAQFAAIVSGEAARLATIELQFEITGSSRADYLQEKMDTVRNKIRTQLEYACALGGMMLKPNGSGVEFIKQGDFIPTDINGDEDIAGAIFMTHKQVGNKFYTKLEYQRFEDGVYKISNRSFSSTDPTVLGQQIALSLVEGWETVSPELIVNGIDKPLFSYLKMPWANQIDMASPLGTSIFSRAVGSIYDIDRTATGLRREISTADRRLFVDDKILRKDDKGNVLDNPFPDLIVGLKYPVNETNTYHEFNPEIRIAQYRQSMQTFLNIAGNQCGFSNGYFSFDEKTGVVTATQVEADQQRTISTATDIQKSLKSALSGLTYALDVYASLYGLAPQGSYEENYVMRDLSVNVTEDRLRAWQMAMANVIPKWKYLMDYEGYSEDDAKATVAEAQQASSMFPGEE